ncbi:Hypothetical protein, putative [Bodo saltans]|uniref:Uncharacterized protein n=1 Tax=Bodo saltans TaxID=75058 RepID=A0A0S4JM17_BODSA|nr:Hypothetical protein, putative [Bodo saltans]|eukprot:CUG91173.1 Hypothetical protein, putative [Bodo saltans]
MWVGCWNLGGVPFHSEDAIYYWATMHLPTAGSMEDILVFSLQAVGGLSEEGKKYEEAKNPKQRRTVSTAAAATEEGGLMSSIAVTPVMAIGEHICAALRKREHNNASYRLLKGIASDDEDAEDALIVIAKDHIAVHVSSVQAQVLSCSTKHSSAPGSGLAVALGIGRSNVCFVSVRLPAVSATSSSFVAKEAAIVRQQRMYEYLSQIRLGDPTVDASVFFDALVVCGDLGESASDQFLGQTTTPTVTRGGVKGTALQWFAEIQPTYPPTCPVVLGSRNVIAASLSTAGELPSKKSGKNSSPSTGSTAVCRQLSYSGRVVYRDNAQYVVVAQGSSDNTTSTKKKASSRSASGSSVMTTTASLVPLLQQTVPSAGASSAARTAALCVAESLPMSWVSAWTFLRSTALSYEPVTASSSSSSVSSSRCKNPQPLCIVSEVRVCFPSPAVRPALLHQLRLYLSSRHGLVQPAHVTGAVVKVLEDAKSDSVTCVFSLSPPSSRQSAAALAIATTTCDRTLLRNEDVVLSFVWGLSGSKASVAGSTKIALAKLLGERDDQQDNNTKVSSFVITGLCLERGSKAIGDVSLTLQRSTL